MARMIASLVALAFVGLSGVPATAGIYSDDLGKCLVAHASDEDKILLVQWIFSAISVHPAVLPFVTMTAERRQNFNDAAAKLASRLLADDCRTETLAALKYEGSAAIESSFQLLGSISMKSLMGQADVEKSLDNVGHAFAKDEKLRALLKEAGTK